MRSPRRHNDVWDSAFLFDSFRNILACIINIPVLIMNPPKPTFIFFNY